MKKIALICLLILSGCSATPPSWQQGNQVEVEQSTVILKSNLWLNKMPAIGEEQDQTLHGALYLEANTDLPAELEIGDVSIKQGDTTWIIEGEDLELRTHSEIEWEVVFIWQLDLDSDKPVDVAVELIHQGQSKWLVEPEVKVDSVY